MIYTLGSVNFSTVLNPGALFDSGGPLFQVCFADSNHDDAIALFYSEPNSAGGSGFSVVVVDISGAQTFYSTGFVGPATSYIKFIINLGGGLFFVVVSNNAGAGPVYYLLQIQNAKLNNRIPIRITKSYPFNFNCYNNPTFFAYDPVKKLLGAAAYNPVGQFGGPCYSETYSISSSGILTKKTGGFVGYFVSGQTTGNFDPYNTSTNTSNFYLASNSTFTQSNGIVTSYGTIGGVQPWYNIRHFYSVEKGFLTDCATPNGSYATSNASGVPYQFNVYNLYTNQFDSNIPGITGGTNFYGGSNGDPAIQLFDLLGNTGQIFYGPSSVYAVWCCVGKNHIWVTDPSAPSPNISIDSFSTPQYFSNGTIVNGHKQIQTVNLVNLSRPVSPLGAFKT